MKNDTLQALYVDELKELYHAEHLQLRGLTRMARASSAVELGDAFGEHLAETVGQIDRLDEIFEELGIEPEGRPCRAMEEFLEEVRDTIVMFSEPTVRDAGLIAAAQRVEHFELAGYASARTLAHLLGYERAAYLLQETIDEEAAADRNLTDLADSVLNTHCV